MGCLFILEINPLIVALFANIFSQSVGCLFFLVWKCFEFSWGMYLGVEFLGHVVTLVFHDDSAGKESTCIAGDTGDTNLIPGLGTYPGGGSGNPLQYFCLKNPMDRGAWWAAVQGSQRIRHCWAPEHTGTHVVTLDLIFEELSDCSPKQVYPSTLPSAI